MKINTRAIAEIGVGVALAVVLSLVKVLQMPQGGSVSLEMIPIFYLALWRGTGVGILAGLVLGLAKLWIEPYIVHPVQLIMDYPLPFLLLGLAGIWPKRPFLGVTVATVARFMVHVLSGVVFFASYAPKGSNVWVYSAVYNGSYLLPELVISLAVIWFLIKSLRINRKEWEWK